MERKDVAANRYEPNLGELDSSGRAPCSGGSGFRERQPRDWWRLVLHAVKNVGTFDQQNAEWRRLKLLPGQLIQHLTHCSHLTLTELYTCYRPAGGCKATAGVALRAPVNRSIYFNAHAMPDEISTEPGGVKSQAKSSRASFVSWPCGTLSRLVG